LLLLLQLQLLQLLLLLLRPGDAASYQQCSWHFQCNVCWHCYLYGNAEKLEGWGEWKLGRWVLQLLLGHLHRQDVGPGSTGSDHSGRSSIPQPSTIGNFNKLAC
jgi:hypothetical protein